MKKFLRIFASTLVIALAFTLYACSCSGDKQKTDVKPTEETPVKTQETTEPVHTPTPTPQPPTPTPELEVSAIETVLTTFANNDPVKVEGVVYGVVSNGFYVADSLLGRIFVIMGSNWEANVAMGDKVQVTGKFGYTQYFPQIKGVTEVKVLSSNNDLIGEATEADVDVIAKLSYKEKTGIYGKVYKVTAAIGKNAANIYTLTDDAGNLVWVNSNSNISALDEHIDSRVTLEVIIHSYSQSDNKWQVSFVGTADDIESNALSFDDILAYAKEHIDATLALEAYGALKLPSRHNSLEYVTYSWSCPENDIVTITNNKCDIKITDTDNVIKLTVTVSDGNETGTLEYDVTFKGIVERKLSSLNELTTDFSIVKVRGIVVGKARNQSESLRSLFIMDPETKDTFTVDFTTAQEGSPYIALSDERFKAVNTGDEILVTAAYRFSDRPTIMNVLELTVVSSGNAYTQDFDNAYVLEDQEDYDYLGLHYKEYSNTLVKIVNPYFCYSTSSTPLPSNWVRFGYDANSPDAGYGDTTLKHYFAFLIQAQNENLGTETWHTTLEIPFTNKGAKQYEMTIYAYCLYISDTYVAFIIPDQSCIITSNLSQVEMFLKGSIPSSVEKGTIELPKTHELVTGEISWQSDNAAINVETGEITPSDTDNLTVKLTATYTVDGETQTLEFEVTVLKDAPMTVSELLAVTTDGLKLKVNGTIVGYVHDGNTTATRYGVIIMDPTTKDLALVGGLAALGGSYGEFKDSNGNVLKIGDNVTFVGTYYLDSAAVGSGPAQTGRNYLEITSQSTVTLVSSDNDITFGEAKVTITNNDEMLAFAQNLKFGQLIKLVGTKENPICLGGSSSDITKVNYKIFFNKDAQVNDDTKYNGYIFSLKAEPNEANAGAEWYKTIFGIDGAFIGPSASRSPICYVGELYIVVTFHTSTYYQCAIVNLAQTNLTSFVAPEKVGDEIVKGLATEINSGDLTLELPTTHALVDDTITWESSSEVIDLTNKKVAYVDNDTEVTLTGSYKVEGTDYTCTLTVKVLKSSTKAEVEAELFKEFTDEIASGTLNLNLPTEVLDITGITWSVDKEEVINLSEKTVATVAVDTDVVFTATYTFRGESTTSTKTVKVSSTVKLDDVKAQLVYGIPTVVSPGDLPFTLPTSHDNVTGEITWVSNNEAIDLTNGKVGEPSENTDVTLTGTFTFKENTETVEITITVKVIYTIDEVLLLDDATPVKTTGIIVAYISDGNSQAERHGVILMDKTSKTLLLVDGLSNIGGEYGAFKASNEDLLAIGDEIQVNGTYYLNTEKIGSTGPEQTGRHHVYLTDSDFVKVLSTGNEFTFGEATVTITNNDELTAFASNLQFGVLVKMVGTENDPILLGGSSSKYPFNVKLFMNKAATTNDGTKYGGYTFALKSDTQAANFDGNATWYTDAFGIEGAFVGPKDAQLPIPYVGVVYFVVGYNTSTYYQLTAVNTANWGTPSA